MYCDWEEFEAECAYEHIENAISEKYKNNEKYYWKTKEGKFIKTDDIDDNHLKNIIYKFGKDKLDNSGYHNIVLRFKELLKNENKEENK